MRFAPPGDGSRHSDSTPRWRRLRPDARLAALAVLALIVLWRSSVFVFWPQAHLDANESVFGLMAKHIAEGRAFPLFMYGQRYMLAVEAWLAAPLFLAFGVSVTALKLPLLAINLVILVLLLRALIDEVGLSPWLAGVAVLFFALPGPGTSAMLLEASGGILEPLLYVLLLWATRRRPGWCGMVLGVGFLHREFSIYGFLALLVLAAARGQLFTREGLGRLGRTLRLAAELWLIAQLLRPMAPAMGPGTTAADLVARAGAGLAGRLGMDLAAVPHGLAGIVTVHWPLLFATRVENVRSFRVETNVVQGLPWLGLVLAAAMLLAMVRIATRVLGERRWRPQFDFCAYLVLIGAFSVAGYVVGRAGAVEASKVRYDVLSILGAIGLAAWFLQVESSRRARVVWMVLVLAWVGVSAIAHGRIWAEYLRHPPVGGKELIARHLEARGVKYGLAGYATAYPVTFLTKERIIMASTNRVRIKEYQTEVAAHRGEAVVVSRYPCGDAHQVLPGYYFCPAVAPQASRPPQHAVQNWK